MFKKISLAVAISLLATPSFSGLYVGASLGPEGASFSQKSHGYSAHDDLVDKELFSGLGVFGSLFAGYGRNFNRFYLAGEVNANVSSLKYEKNNDEYIYSTIQKTSFTIRNSEGVSLLPGYYLSDDTLFYTRIGYINGRIQIREGADSSINSMTKNRSGIRYGAGVRHNLTSQWTVMMDYSQINYDSLKSHYVDPLSGFTKDSKISPSSAQVGFGILYNFDVPKKAYVK